jgi:hypothetical protein
MKIVNFFDSPEGFRGIKGVISERNWEQENSLDLSATSLPCPKFDRCSAPVCPVDPNWRDSVYRKGEPTCFYMRLHAKNALEGQKQGSVPSELRIRVIEVYDEIIDRYAPLKTALEKASKSPAYRFARSSAE